MSPTFLRSLHDSAVLELRRAFLEKGGYPFPEIFTTVHQSSQTLKLLEIVRTKRGAGGQFPEFRLEQPYDHRGLARDVTGEAERGLL